MGNSESSALKDAEERLRNAQLPPATSLPATPSVTADDNKHHPAQEGNRRMDAAGINSWYSQRFRNDYIMLLINI